MVSEVHGSTTTSSDGPNTFSGNWENGNGKVETTRLSQVNDEVLEHLVVDAGAFIRLEQLHGKAKNYWTIREVLQEIRDRRARENLAVLPFELKTREPSEEAVAAIVAFAKKTGDISVLSKPDIRLMALAYMLHKETHGLKRIRTEPWIPGSQDEDDDADDQDDAALNGDGHGDEDDDSQKVDISTLGVKKVGVSWAAALGSSPQPIQVSQKPVVSMTLKVGGITSNEDDENKDEKDEQEDGVKEPKKTVRFADEPMWDDEDFAGVASSSAGAGEATAKEDSDEPVEEWPSLESLSMATESSRQHYLARKQEIEPELRKIDEKARKKREKLAQKQAKQQEAMNAEKQNFLEQLAQASENAHDKKDLPLGSRIIGISGITVESGELEGEGWITPDNITSIDPYASLKGNQVPKKNGNELEKNQEPSVACVTTDYAMQNVLMQMKLRLATLEGRSITHIKRFVLKCDSCAAFCKQLDKKFCPSCGNPTLGRLSYSIDPNGKLRYHYKKDRRVNTRGMRYSVPKPVGGRTGDLLLTEDQLMMGWWSQQAKKKTTNTSMFGENVTESLGLSLNSQGEGIRIGYGRQNPNAAKGREKRGKKKKRSSKRPGYL